MRRRLAGEEGLAMIAVAMLGTKQVGEVKEGARRFDTRIKREQIGLEGDVVDRAQHLADRFGRLRDRLRRRGRRPCAASRRLPELDREAEHLDQQDVEREQRHQEETRNRSDSTVSYHGISHP